MKFKHLFFTIAFMGCALFGSAQAYKSAIGGKVGDGAFGSFKTYMSDHLAVEAVAGIDFNAFYSTLIVGGNVSYAFHLGSLENFSWYVGGGVYFTTNEFNTNLAVGPHGGAEYTFSQFPLNVFADLTPLLFVGRNNDAFNFGYYTVGARYVLGAQ